MSLATYADLKAAVISFANRAGDSSFVSSVPDFIRLAEANIARDVRVLDMLKNQAGSLVSGAVALPSRFLGVRFMSVTMPGQPVATPLDYVEPWNYQTRAGWSAPSNYTIDQGSVLVAGGGTSPYTLAYWQAYAPLAADADTNWLLTNCPDIYLFGALANAYEFQNDPARFERSAVRYKQAADEANRQAKAQMLAGSARVRPRVVA